MIIPINCLAITNVSYSGSSHKFVYDDSGHELNNLFDDFNDAMPGDTIEENIIIKITAIFIFISCAFFLPVLSGSGCGRILHGIRKRSLCNPTGRPQSAPPENTAPHRIR